MSESDAEQPGPAPEPKKRGLGDTAKRLASALPLVPIILWLMFGAPAYAFHAFILVGMAIAAHEVLRMALPESRLLQLLGTAVTIGFSLALSQEEGRFAVPAAVGVGLVALPMALSADGEVEHGLRRLGWLLGTPIYVGALLTPSVLLHRMEHGGAWVLLTMFLSWLSDTGAYFAGRAFGKHKLAPRLSPKKTIEGSVGGIVAATLGAVALSLTILPTLPLVHAIPLGIVATAAGQAGDLLESLMKRSAGVKDSGNVLAGHGGILDRIDALLYTTSLVWVYATLVGLSGTSG